MRVLSVFIIGLLILGGTWTSANSSDGMTFKSCGKIKQPKRKARTDKDNVTSMMLIIALEEQGKGKLRPEFEPLKEQCLLEEFDSNIGTVKAFYSQWSKGMQTLNYQFLIGEGEEQREFLVLYNGMASLLSGNMTFYVSETFKGNAKFYAFYKSQPRYKELKKLILGVLKGTKAPLVDVDWPEDSKELLVNNPNRK